MVNRDIIRTNQGSAINTSPTLTNTIHEVSVNGMVDHTLQNSPEVWKPIPSMRFGFEHLYEASSFGRIRRVGGDWRYYGRILRPGVDRRGYAHVGLIHQGTRATYLVHRLITAAFIGLCPEGKVVNHIDGDTRNNRSENLEYVTPAENLAHAVALRAQPGQVRHFWSPLTHAEILEILNNKSDGPKALAARYQVHRTTIGRIRSGRSWKGLQLVDEAARLRIRQDRALRCRNGHLRDNARAHRRCTVCDREWRKRRRVANG